MRSTMASRIGTVFGRAGRGGRPRRRIVRCGARRSRRHDAAHASTHDRTGVPTTAPPPVPTAAPVPVPTIAPVPVPDGRHGARPGNDRHGQPHGGRQHRPADGHRAPRLGRRGPAPRHPERRRSPAVVDGEPRTSTPTTPVGTRPGVFLVAFPGPTLPATVVTNRDWSGSCTDGGRTPFNDGRFVGEIRLWTACGGGTARFIVLAGTAIDSSVTLMVEILAPTADDTAASMILGTFGTVPGVTYQPDAPVAVPAPVGVVDPLLLQGPVQPGAVTINDDTRHFSVAVPAEWIDVNSVPAFNDDLSDRPRLRASTDLAAMNETWTAPGLLAFVVPAVDPGRLLVNQDLSNVCTDGGLQTFDNGIYRGFLRVWSACGGTATRVRRRRGDPGGQPDGDDVRVGAVADRRRHVVEDGPRVDGLRLTRSQASRVSWRVGRSWGRSGSGAVGSVDGDVALVVHVDVPAAFVDEVVVAFAQWENRLRSVDLLWIHSSRWWISQLPTGVQQPGMAQVRYIVYTARRWAGVASREPAPTSSGCPSDPSTAGMMLAVQQ